MLAPEGSRDPGKQPSGLPGTYPHAGAAAVGHETPLQRLVFLATAALLTVTFVSGGGSYGRGWVDAIAQLAALLLLVMAIASASRIQLLVIGMAALVLAGVALQLLPLPGHVSRAHDIRAGILSDLAIAGVDGVPLRISLTPWATERGLWSLLPAMAAYSAALVLAPLRQRQLTWLLVGLVTCSLLLAYLQLGAPQGSPLNFFPEWAPALNGMFANPNHQATAITVALILVLSWLFDGQGAHRGVREEAGSMPRAWSRGAAVVLVLFLLVTLPLTGSRAMVLVAAGAMLAVPVLGGWLSRQFHRRGRRRLALAMGIAGGVAAALLLVAISGWIKVDNELESRRAVTVATGEMALDAMPLGTGLGSFVPWFDAHASAALFKFEYFNHAHNEYVQWWLESGTLGLLWILLLLAAMAWAFPRQNKTAVGDDGRWLATGAWLAVAVVLAHSLVDYPLRTSALMTVAAWLAGVTVAAALARRRRKVEVMTPGSRG